MAIAEAELASFVELGFLAVPHQLCPDDELEALRQEYDRLFAPVHDDDDRIARQREGRHFDLGGPSGLEDDAEDDIELVRLLELEGLERRQVLHGVGVTHDRTQK